jgi:hypothetical protein
LKVRYIVLRTAALPNSNLHSRLACTSGREQPSKKEAKEIEATRKFRNPKLASKKVVLKCTRNVLHGTNSRCKANFWNRDVNAVRIMLKLLRSGLKGELGASRLRAFRRNRH